MTFLQSFAIKKPCSMPDKRDNHQRFAILIPIYTVATVPAKKNPSSSIALFRFVQHLRGRITIVLFSSLGSFLVTTACAASSLFVELFREQNNRLFLFSPSP
jgi:hypothetical protein